MNNDNLKPGLKQAWSNFYHQLVTDFLDIGNWSYAQRTILVAGLALTYQVLVLAVWELLFGSRDSLSNYSAWRDYQLLWVAVSALILLASVLINRTGSRIKWPFVMFVCIYHACVVLGMYGLGTLASYVNALPVCTLIVVLVVYELKTFLITALFTAVLFAGIVISEVNDFIPYAPFLINRDLETLNNPAYVWIASLTLTVIIFQVVTVTLLVLSALKHSEQRWVRVTERIRRYMPPAVADKIIAGNEETIEAPQRRRVTVLFADIVGFTDLADRVEPETTTQVLNEYLSTMVELIENHGGTLNEFAGDGLMALFGAPEPLEPGQQVRSAIESSRAMARELTQLNRRWRKLGLGQDLEVRIGINTGVLSVGSFGSVGRMTYTAIGLQTNVTARIQAHCKPGEVLLSEASWQLVSNEINCTAQGSIRVKGLHFPVSVYSLNKPDHQPNKVTPIHHLQ